MLDFYKIVKETSENGKFLFEVRLNRGCEVYKGHFPGHPVCPGVCNLEMIRECAEKVTGQKLVLSGIKQCRMTSLLTPDIDRNLVVSMEISKDSYPYSFSSVLYDNETIYITIKGKLSEQNCFPLNNNCNGTDIHTHL